MPELNLRRVHARAALALLLFLAVLFAHERVGNAAQPATDTNKVLVVYDSSGEYGWIGNLNAILLGNLLGHFPLAYDKKPVESYQAGDINRYRMIFYLGTVYDNALPNAFLTDVMATSKTVCWMKYNLMRLGQGSSFGAAFESKFGFRFEFMDPASFTNIVYKGETFSRHPADAELGRITILNSNVARASAVASNHLGNTIPYIVRGSNFWYVGDVPFSYMSEEDRYLVFADLLHDIVGIDHPESHRAIIRFEDVDPTYDTDALRAIANYLQPKGVPFAVATIPVYADPHGYYYEGEPTRVEMAEAPGFISALKYMVARGGQLIMHGYTHQYNSELNPYTGVSGDDFEFFRIVLDEQLNVVTYTPVPEDSRAWVQGRLAAGLEQFARAGLQPVAWEPPHYAASALDYRVFAETFPLTIQRVLYFDDAGRVAGQMFPYPIQKDYYGQKVLPENLGNVEPEQWYNYPARLPADIIRAARKNLVVRDGWASSYFHPYLDISYLREVIEGIQALGYTFVPLTENVAPTIVTDPQSAAVPLGDSVTLRVEAVGSPTLRYRWRKNGSLISGATNALLTLSNVRVSNSGTYTAEVSNRFGTNTSAGAVITVAAPPLRIYESNGMKLSFQARANHTYRLEFKNSLSSSSWQVFQTFDGRSGTVTVSDHLARFRAMRLYRLRAE